MHAYEYPRPAVAVDLIVLRQSEPEPQLLLIERKHDPYAGCWALPGGFLDEGETLEAAAARELLEETSAKVLELQQFKAYSAVDRDPRTRVISVVFSAKIDAAAAVVAGDDAAKAVWFPVSQLPKLAFDHANILTDYFGGRAK